LYFLKKITNKAYLDFKLNTYGDKCKNKKFRKEILKYRIFKNNNKFSLLRLFHFQDKLNKFSSKELSDLSSFQKMITNQACLGSNLLFTKKKNTKNFFVEVSDFQK
jgi:hypothetical protein